MKTANLPSKFSKMAAEAARLDQVIAGQTSPQAALIIGNERSSVFTSAGAAQFAYRLVRVGTKKIAGLLIDLQEAADLRGG